MPKRPKVLIHCIRRYGFRMIGWMICLLWSSSCEVNKFTNTSEGRPVDKVFPQLDTNHSRWFFFSSASRPFGMVNLSPDTETDSDWGGGYRYDTDTVKGFSHIHAWQLAGPSIMPIIPGVMDQKRLFQDYSSSFNHQTETVSPGYHRLFLERYQIKTELTSTRRVGFHRYTSPENMALLFNLNGPLGPGFMSDGVISKTKKADFITGQVTNLPTFRRPKACTVYFAAQFSRSYDHLEQDPITGNYIVYFENSRSKPLMVKVAVSYTSVENAVTNMKEELPGWDFNQVVEESRNEWNSLLSRIEVDGGTPQQQQRFYTDLWHALQGRRIISDSNGAYPDNTGDGFRIGQLPCDANGEPLFHHYNSDSFWGAQWTLNTLWGLAYPEIMEEFVHSLMQYYKDGGLIPRGPSGGNYTYVMTGASSNPFIISAIQKGIVKDDLENIYQALRKNQMPGGIMEKAGYEHHTSIGGGLSWYMGKGYVPYPLSEMVYGAHQDGAGMTLEYAFQDWALAQLAQRMGKEEDFRYFLKRSENYKKLFDPVSGWMRPKNKEGEWKKDYDPYQIDHGFIEANGAQSTWFVPHDYQGLSHLMGGEEAASAKLNQAFLEAEKQGFTAGSSHERETHPEYSRIPVNYGNQPSIHTAFIFNYLGKPWLTQYWSRRVTEEVYEGVSPQVGYNGDEDQGLMGALAVLMKIGLFSMQGGCSPEPALELGSPVFDRVTIQLHPDYYPGKTLVIEARNNSAQNVYIQSARWNGNELHTWSIPQSDLVQGGTLLLEMGEKPNMQWGIR